MLQARRTTFLFTSAETLPLSPPSQPRSTASSIRRQVRSVPAANAGDFVAFGRISNPRTYFDL